MFISNTANKINCKLYLRNRKRVACVYGVIMHAGNVRRIREKRVKHEAYTSVLHVWPLLIHFLSLFGPISSPCLASPYLHVWPLLI